MFELSGIGVITAFAAGLISFLSPCVLPLVPGYLSYIGGQSLEETQDPGLLWWKKLTVLSLSFCFILGFSTVFIIFGASASVIGRLLMAYRFEANILGGFIIILFGLFMTGLLRFTWLQREFRYYGEIRGSRPLAAYLLGVAFAFGWTPCIGPILGAILTLNATTGLGGDGTVLLAIYSIGLGTPFIAAALFTDWFLHHSKRLRRHGHMLQISAGMILIIMGIAMVSGYLTSFSLWLLDMLPWLSKIG
jgi:cytochrome c-type biogenesis protein